MTLCLPSCVMANRARSVCPLYRRVTSAISDIAPASFGVPSTLKTGMGLRKERVGMSFAFAYSASMNNPSAPQSSSAWRLCLQPEVVSMSTSRSRELELRIAEIVNFCGSRRSQQVRGGVGGGGEGWFLHVFCIIVRGGSRIYYIFYYKTTETITTRQRGHTNHLLRDAKSEPEATVTSSSISEGPTEGAVDGSSGSDTSTSARKFINQSLRSSVAMARTLRRT